MAKLIIKRSWHFISLKRAFKVFIDGERVASVKNADTIELDVAPGEHVVRTGINAFEGLSPKLRINLSADQPLTLVTAPNNIMILSILLSVIGGILLAAGFTVATELWFYGAAILAVGLILAVKFAIKLRIEPHPHAVDHNPQP